MEEAGEGSESDIADERDRLLAEAIGALAD